MIFRKEKVKNSPTIIFCWYLISERGRCAGSQHSSLKKRSGGVKEWQGKAQWSDLGLIKIPPLTKETKNAAKCWHLQFLAIASYFDNILGHFWSVISQAFDQLQFVLAFEIELLLHLYLLGARWAHQSEVVALAICTFAAGHLLHTRW